MAPHSTREVARKLGLHFTTLHRYIAAKKVPLPPLTRLAGVKVRLWSDADIEKVRALLPKIANGRKTRYQRKRKKQKTRKPKQ